MSGYLVCEKHGESFTKSCSTCVYEAGVKFAEAIHNDLQQKVLQNDEYRRALEEIVADYDYGNGGAAPFIAKKALADKRVDEIPAQTPQVAWASAAKRRPCWNCKPIHVDPPRECGCVCHT